MSFSWQGKFIVVTGGSGFLGQNFIELLKAKGLGDNYWAPPHSAFDLTVAEQTEQLLVQAVRRKPGLPRVLVALAGKVGGIQANLNEPADFFYENLLINAHTLRYARACGVEKVVLLGAGCGYPEHAPLPLKEDDFWNGYPQLPSASYSLAKRMIHTQALAEYKQYGLKSAIVMPGNIYGPFDNFNLETAHVIPALVRKFVDAVKLNATEVEVWGSGGVTRDFVYAGDVCEGLYRAAEAYDGPQLVNVSSGAETMINEVVDLLIKQTGYKGRLRWNKARPEGQDRRWFDISKAKRDFGYEPTPLARGLELTVEWFQKNRQLARVA